MGGIPERMFKRTSSSRPKRRRPTTVSNEQRERMRAAGAAPPLGTFNPVTGKPIVGGEF